MRPRLLCALVCVLALGCGGRTFSPAPAGSEQGGCFPDGTCDPGLVCARHVCVAAVGPDAGTPPDGPLLGRDAAHDARRDTAVPDASPPDTGGCSPDPATDPLNCGSCGHSCLGGACEGGFCQPVLIAGDPTHSTKLKSLYGLVALDGFVYGTNWEASGGLVYRVSATPGGSVDWLVGAGTAASADALATNGTSLIYSIFHVGEPAGAGIWTVHTDGSGNRLIVSGGTTGGGPDCDLVSAYGYEVDGLAFDSGFVYWIRDTYGGCFPTNPGCQCQGLYRADADGSGGARFFTTNWYTAPLADSGTLYMVDYFNMRVVTATSAMVTSHTPPMPLSPGGAPKWVQTDPDYAYWIDTSAKQLYRAKKVGATNAETITPATGMPGGSLWFKFLVDQGANRLYFVSPAPAYNTYAAQQIYVMPKDGSGPAQAIPGALISPQGDSASAFIQDTTALYWTTYGFDTNPPPYSAVYKLAK